jgi:ribonuclease H-related protein
MTKKKFYAVRVGRQTGVFDDWKKAEQQVNKFKGAIYQSFDNPKIAWEFVRANAQEFELKFANQQIDTTQQAKVSPTQAVAYTDGSFDATSQTYSYGVVILWNQKLIKMARRFKKTRDVELRNVAGELEGAIRALKFAHQNKIKSLTLYHDYQGIAAWATGKWKANLPLTQEYRDYVEKLRVDLDVKFVWVKGHSGDYYNEMVDALASHATLTEYRKVEKNA